MTTSKYARTALFVDFDNIFISLKKQEGQAIAHRFATGTADWLRWLEHEMSLAHLGEEYTSRRILIRKCYLNPAVFANFRPYFTRTAFEVVDCPPLTEGGKTSADIHMVMDIMDTLHHPSHYDEFILLSADADFTPVLLRVRHFDRRSVVLAAGLPSPAYKSACDFLPPLELFLSEALGVKQDEEETKIPVGLVSADGKVLDQLSELLLQRVSANGVVYSYDLPAIYKHVDEFCNSNNWLDFGSLRRLTEAVVRRRSQLGILEDLDQDSWGVYGQINPVVKPAGNGKSVSAVRPERAAEPEIGDLRTHVTEFVIEMVKNSPAPVVMAQMAEQVTRRFGRQLSLEGWLGAASFKSMLQQLDLNGLQIHNAIPGYIYDPSRHNIEAVVSNENLFDPKQRLTEEFKEKYPDIQPLAYKVCQLTDMPYLLPEHYTQVLHQVARAINEKGYELNVITRVVRDRCVERGVPVSRKAVNFIVVGISYSGYRFAQPGQSETAEVLAEQLYKNTLNLCQSVQVSLDDCEKELLRKWLTEGVIDAE